MILKWHNDQKNSTKHSKKRALNIRRMLRPHHLSASFILYITKPIILYFDSSDKVTITNTLNT